MSVNWNVHHVRVVIKHLLSSIAMMNVLEKNNSKRIIRKHGVFYSKYRWMSNTSYYEPYEDSFSTYTIRVHTKVCTKIVCIFPNQFLHFPDLKGNLKSHKKIECNQRGTPFANWHRPNNWPIDWSMSTTPGQALNYEFCSVAINGSSINDSFRLMKPRCFSFIDLMTSCGDSTPHFFQTPHFYQCFLWVARCSHPTDQNLRQSLIRVISAK